VIEVVLMRAALEIAAPQIAPEIRDRYAFDIAQAVDDVETGFAVVATAEAESTFDTDIEHCICKPWQCDQGKAAGLYQLHARWYDGYSQAQICESNPLSTSLAVRALTQLRRITGSWEAAFARYRGAMKAGDPHVLRRVRLFQRLQRSVPVS